MPPSVLPLFNRSLTSVAIMAEPEAPGTEPWRGMWASRGENAAQLGSHTTYHAEGQRGPTRLRFHPTLHNTPAKLDRDFGEAVGERSSERDEIVPA